MTDENKTETASTTIIGIDVKLHKAIKMQALLRDVNINVVYLEIVNAGTEALKITPVD